MFDDLIPSQKDEDLNSLVEQKPTVNAPPEASVKTRAAKAALLSKGSPTEQYQALLAESEQGSEQSLKNIFDSEAARQGKLDFPSVISVLSDPYLSPEHKQKVISSINNNKTLSDPNMMLMSSHLMAPNVGETKAQEEARLSVADILGEVYQSINDVQGIVNAHTASLDSGLGRAAPEMIEHWVLPFGNSISVGKLGRAQAERDANATWWDKLKGFVLPGSRMEELSKKLESLPYSERAAWVRGYVEDLKNHSGIVFSTENQFSQFQNLHNVVSGDYGTVDKWLDNFSPVLDAIGIGQTLRAAKSAKLAKKLPEIPKTVEVPKTPELLKTPVVQPDSPLIPTPPTKPQAVLLGGTGKKPEAPQKKIAALLMNTEMNGVVKVDNPASPAKVIQQANPTTARALHEAVVVSTEDEAARALYGSSRVDAVASDIMPQGTVDGTVRSKVTDIGINLRKVLDIAPEILAVLHGRGHIEMLPEEKMVVQANVVNDFRSVTGLTLNDSMSSFSVDGGRIKIGAVYGTPQGGFASVQDAIDFTNHVLRKYAITDENIEILKKQGIDHVPIDPADYANVTGDYMIRVNTYHDIDPTDVVKRIEGENVSQLQNLPVSKLAVFDSIPALVSNTKGSVSRWLFDAGSLLHKSLTGGAATVSDYTARMDKALFEIASDFAKVEKKLTKLDSDKLWDYLKEANFKGIELSDQDLVARGFSNEMLDATHKWRRFWDHHFYLENYDLVRTLNAEGFQLFRNATTELYAKPVPRNLIGGAELSNNQVVGGTKLYNPAMDNVTVLTKDELDDLYAKGGTIARLRRPTDFNGVTAEHMIIRNTPTEYLRKFKDTDMVLNYRPGYFQLQYTAPKFVEQVIRRADGTVEYTKAVAVAGDTKEAEFFMKQLAQSGDEYRVRGDDRALKKDPDSWWDVNAAQGRIAQRYRGKLLEDASGMNYLGDQSYILNPVESAIRASRSIAGRSISRPMLETAKARFVKQFENYLTPNRFGEFRFPRSLEEIGRKGEFTSAELGNARTTWEYINYLENGYINSADSFYKAFLNMIADRAGKLGYSTVERMASKAGEGSHGPVSLTKNLVFMSYIGTNVLRQWIVQPHQVLRTIAYNPQAWATGNLHRYITAFAGDTVGIAAKGDAAEFVKFAKESGFLDNVDKQNLVRGVLLDAADRSNKLQRWSAAPFNAARMVGFDLGERVNMLGHLAAVFDRYKREGKPLNTKIGRDEAYSEARAISYDMNFAGDMPYNQTTPAMFLQFMQVPHKALLQLTNKRIPIDLRMRMLVGDMVFWGTPAYLISDMFGEDILPDDPVLREKLTWGVEGVALNKLFSLIAGREVKADVTSLAPADLTGWGKMYMALREGGMKEMMLSAPASTLLWKDGSRFSNAMHALGRYMNIIEDDDANPETALSVLNEVLKMSSGYNNAYKAKLIMETRKILDQYGSVIDDNAGVWEAALQTLGFGTMKSRDWYKASNELYKDNKDQREQWDKVYNDIMRMYAEKLGTDNQDPRFMTSVSSLMLKMYKDNPAALDYINKKYMRDITGKDSVLLGKMLRSAGVVSADDIRNAPLTEEQKTRFFQIKKELEKEVD